MLVNQRRADFVVITPLEEEREAVLRRLPGARKLPALDDDVHVYYEVWLPLEANQKEEEGYRVIVCSPVRMGRVEASSLATHAFRLFRPNYVLVVGIAGGIKDEVELGDVLIAAQVVDYELQKVTDQGAHPRYRVYDPDRRLLARAQHLDGWQTSIEVTRPVVGVSKRRVGSVASGDKVLAQANALSALRETWPKLIGVEMEAGGVHVAAQAAVPSCGVLMIRGVSDLADEDKDTPHVKAWRSYACDVAAAFAVALLKDCPVPASRLHSDAADALVAGKAPGLVDRKPSRCRPPLGRNPRFQGRSDLLNKIHDLLFADSSAKSFVALTGLRGVGKTQLALEYAYSYAEDRPEYTDVLWIRGDTQELLRSDFAMLADTLNLEEKQRSEPELKLGAVRHWLGKNDGWLLIIDGADDKNAVGWLSPLLPARHTGHVMVTTTNPNWRAFGDVLTVDVLATQDAVSLLVKRSGQPQSVAIVQLAELLGRLPLALVQAAAYIERTGMSSETYVQLLVQRQAEVLARPLLDDYPATVATVWLLSFERIQKASPAGALLLYLGAFLAPVEFPFAVLVAQGDDQLPASLVKLQPLSDPLSLQDAIADLRAYSLVNVWGDFLWIHPLVQAMLRHYLGAERKQWATLTAELVRLCFRYSSYNPQTWEKSSFFFPHAWVSIVYAMEENVNPTLVAQLGGRLGDYYQTHVSSQLAAQLLGQIDEYCTATGSTQENAAFHELRIQRARTLCSVGQWSLAVELLDGLQRELRLTDHTAQNDSILMGLPIERGNALLIGGKYADALKAGQEALQLQSMGGEVPPVLTATADGLVGLALVELARFQEGRGHLEKALAVLPKDDENSPMLEGVLLHNLGLARLESGDVAGAEQAYRSAIAKMELHLGPYHPQTGACRGQLGRLFEQRGEYRAARQEFRKAYWASRHFSADTSIELSRALKNLCEVYLFPGYLKRARVLAEQSLKINLQLYEERHPETIHSYGLLARALHGTKEDQAARACFDKSCALTEELFGPDHPETASVHHNMGVFLVDIEDFETGRWHLERALSIDEKVYGKEHFEVATDLDSLSQLYLLRKEWEQALPLLERVLAIREQQFGPMSARALHSVSAAARMLSEQGAWPLSLRYYEILVAALERAADKNAVQLCAALHEQASALIESGTPSAAHAKVERASSLIALHDEIPPSLRSAVQWQKSRLARLQGNDVTAESGFSAAEATISLHRSMEQTEVLAARHRERGQVLTKQDDFQGAVQAYHAALLLLDNESGSDSVLLANTLIELGAAEVSSNSFTSAKEHLERALSMTLRLRAESHATAGTACRRLGELHRALGEHILARAYFQRAYETWLRVFGPSHPHVGAVLVDLGGSEIQTQDLTAAEKHLSAAEVLLIEKLNEHSYEEVQRHLPIALIRLRMAQGRLPQAGELLTKALETTTPDKKDGQRIELIFVLYELSEAHQARGQLITATAQLEQATALLDAHPTQEPLLYQLRGRLYQALALLYRQCGKRRAAYEAMAKAYERVRQTPVSLRDPGLLAQVAVSYANYLRLDKNFAQAKTVLAEAIKGQDGKQEADDESDAQSSILLHILMGEILLHLREESESISHLEQAIAAVEQNPELLQSPHISPDLFAELYCNAGLCLLRLNKDSEHAVNYLRVSLRREAALYGDDHQRTALATLELARGLYQLRQIEEARRLAQQARQIFRRTGPENLSRAAEELFRQLRDTIIVSKGRKKSHGGKK